MAKKHWIYKKDNWNMMTVEMQGKVFVLSEISEQWGEETHTFQSRAEMMNWVERRFSETSFEGSEQERNEIIHTFKQL